MNCSMLVDCQLRGAESRQRPQHIRFHSETPGGAKAKRVNQVSEDKYFSVQACTITRPANKQRLNFNTVYQASRIPLQKGDSVFLRVHVLVLASPERADYSLP
jgi:hypothetical protein